MKKLFYYSIALLAAVSCAKEIAPDNNVEAPKGDLKTFTIGASIDNEPIAPANAMAKANLNSETLEVLWQTNDKIGLVTEDGTITPATLVADYNGKSEGVFEYQSETKLDVKYAYYPYSETEGVCNQSVVNGKLNISLLSTQNRVKNGLVRQNTLIMVAKADGGNVVFKNTCAIVKISVKGKSVETRNLYVHAPWAALNGAGTVDMTAENPVFVTNPIDYVNLSNIPERSSLIAIKADKVTTITPTQDDYVLAGYLVVPAGTYHGLSFETLSTEGDNTAYIQSYSSVRDITLNVGKIRPLNVTIDVPAEYKDLSEDGNYANCYMIQNETEEYFGFGLYTRAYSNNKGVNAALNLSNAYNATVLWQSTEGLISSVTYNRANAMIYFKRDTQKTGNAVLALSSREGQVIYSWHIWVVGEEVSTNVFGDAELMDRNLGSYGTLEHTKIGVYYQWGRKDPFPGASLNATSGNVQRSEVYPDYAVNTVVEQDGKTSDWAKLHPSVYIWGSSNNDKQDWLSKQDNSRWYYSSMSNKLIDDPCPYGYRVPSYQNYGNNAIHTLLANGVADGLSLTIKDKNNKNAVFYMAGRWQRSNVNYIINNFGNEGWLWTCNGTSTLDKSHFGSNSISGVAGSRKLNFSSGSAAYAGNGVPRRWGANVRCIKFTEVDAE